MPPPLQIGCKPTNGHFAQGTARRASEKSDKPSASIIRQIGINNLAARLYKVRRLKPAPKPSGGFTRPLRPRLRKAEHD